MHTSMRNVLKHTSIALTLLLGNDFADGHKYFARNPEKSLEELRQTSYQDLMASYGRHEKTNVCIWDFYTMQPPWSNGYCALDTNNLAGLAKIFQTTLVSSKSVALCQPNECQL